MFNKKHLKILHLYSWRIVIKVMEIVTKVMEVVTKVMEVVTKVMDVATKVMEIVTKAMAETIGIEAILSCDKVNLN